MLFLCMEVYVAMIGTSCLDNLGNIIVYKKIARVMPSSPLTEDHVNFLINPLLVFIIGFSFCCVVNKLCQVDIKECFFKSVLQLSGILFHACCTICNA